jgi:hypothetical protein
LLGGLAIFPELGLHLTKLGALRESGLTCVSGRCLSSYLLFLPVPVTSELRVNLAQGRASTRRHESRATAISPVI